MDSNVIQVEKPKRGRPRIHPILVRKAKGRPVKYSSEEERIIAKKKMDAEAYKRYRVKVVQNRKLAEEFKKMKEILEGKAEVN
jgi:hypothetical protein